MSEVTLYQEGDTHDQLVPAAGYTSGQMLQLADGRAAYVLGLRSLSSGDMAALKTTGQVTLAKTASVVCLKGSKAYWDKSANTVTPLQAMGTNDFYVGTFSADAAAADTTAIVDLNVQPSYLIELGRGEWESTPVYTNGTAAVTFTGGTTKLSMSNTAEVSKLDIISKQSFLAGEAWIAEGKMAIYDIGDAAALDINVGVANATHASDADEITESVLLHFDGNALDIKAESDDGTTEVAATDTTVNAVDDTYFQFAIDARDPSDVQIYVNGVLVLASTVFDISEAAGPLKALVHVEKTSDDTTVDVRVSELTVRTIAAA